MKDLIIKMFDKKGKAIGYLRLSGGRVHWVDINTKKWTILSGNEKLFDTFKISQEEK